MNLSFQSSRTNYLQEDSILIQQFNNASMRLSIQQWNNQLKEKQTSVLEFNKIQF